jgi:hypothetical protein
MWLSRQLTLLGIGLLAYFAVSLAFPFRVHAQEQTVPFQLTIAPSVVELAIMPGKAITQVITLKNAGSVDLQVTPQLRDFTSSEISGVPKLLPTISFPYASLANSEIAFDQPFVLKAGQSEQFVLSINVPENAPERDWYFTLLAKTQADTSGTLYQTSLAKTEGTIGANILVRVTQDNAFPLTWKADLPLPKIIDSLQKIEFSPVVTNTSQTYAIPEVSVVILDWRNQIVSEQSGLPERILAQGSRQIMAQQPRKDDPRSLEGVPFILGQRFLLGPYTVRVSIANNTTTPLVVEQTVWAIPFVLLTALLGFSLLWSVLRAYRARSRLDSTS